MQKQRGDQLHVNSAADQRLCFHFIDSTITLLPKSKISNKLSSSLCRTWSEIRKTDFLASCLIYQNTVYKKKGISDKFSLISLLAQKVRKSDVFAWDRYFFPFFT